MKLAIILGRGIEGAGVTRFACELNNFVNANNMHSHIYAIDDKKWPRSNSQSLLNYTLIKPKLFKELSIKLNNEYDVVLYCSIPAKKGYTQQCIDNFYQYLVCDVIKPKKYLTQNDHKKQSLSRNANLYEICKEMTGIFSFSNNTPFFKELQLRYGKEVLNKYIHLQNGINFNELYQFRKNFSLREKRITYLGRYATFKDPYRLYLFHNYVKPYNFKSELIGIERSIGAIYPMFLYEDLKTSKHLKEMYDCTQYYIDRKEQSIEFPYVYGPYNRIETLSQIGNSLFGCSFYNISSEANGNNMEYAQLEMITIGLIPLFDYDWSLHTKINNISINELDYFGIFLKKDLSNAEECASKLEEIYNNIKLRKKYIDSSYEHIQSFSSNVVFLNMIEIMSSFISKNIEIKNKVKKLFL